MNAQLLSNVTSRVRGEQCASRPAHLRRPSAWASRKSPAPACTVGPEEAAMHTCCLGTRKRWKRISVSACCTLPACLPPCLLTCPARAAQSRRTPAQAGSSCQPPKNGHARVANKPLGLRPLRVHAAGTASEAWPHQVEKHVIRRQPVEEGINASRPQQPGRWCGRPVVVRLCKCGRGRGGLSGAPAYWRCRHM